MKINRNIVAAMCLFLGLCVPIVSQVKQQPGNVPSNGTKVVPVSPRECPQAQIHKEVDLCALAKQMGQTGSETEFRALGGESMWLPDHEDVILSWNSEVVWTCNGKSTFEITGIKRIQQNGGQGGHGGNAPQPPQPSFFPFCRNLAGQHDPNQQLHSGTTIPGVIGCFKYSFKVDGMLYDPHLIVTDGSTGDTRIRGIKCDFGHRTIRTHPNPSNK